MSGPIEQIGACLKSCIKFGPWDEVEETWGRQQCWAIVWCWSSIVVSAERGITGLRLANKVSFLAADLSIQMQSHELGTWLWGCVGRNIEVGLVAHVFRPAFNLLDLDNGTSFCQVLSEIFRFIALNSIYPSVPVVTSSEQHSRQHLRQGQHVHCDSLHNVITNQITMDRIKKNTQNIVIAGVLKIWYIILGQFYTILYKQSDWLCNYVYDKSIKIIDSFN